eukprot:14129202-Alexandrium_andersonii.AAC.1
MHIVVWPYGPRWMSRILTSLTVFRKRACVNPPGLCLCVCVGCHQHTNAAACFGRTGKRA